MVMPEVDIREFIIQNKAPNTIRKTKSDLALFKRWCKSVGEDKEVVEMSASELNSTMSTCFVTIKKSNGEDYEPCSLTSLHRSIDRHLKETGSKFRILVDREFEESRQALEAKRKNLRKHGKGLKRNAAQPLTEGEEDLLWESGELGGSNPVTLLHTIWFLCTMHFGWRGVDEHRRVCYGDFELCIDDDSVEYVELKIERGTKTRTGCEGQKERAFNPRMYATGGEKCPIALFKKYISLRPPRTQKPDSPFYLLPANTSTPSIWYKHQPVGVNTLSKFMKVMTDSAGISGNKTNHSAWKTMITKLVQNDVNPLHVAQLTGHKCLKSLDSYSKASLEQQKRMSRLISGHSQPMSNITNTVPVSNSSVTATAKSNHSSGSLLPGMQIYGNNTECLRS